MKSPITPIIERLLWAALTLGCAAILPAHGTTVDTISSNVNGMRELSVDNIVKRIPGAAPYYGPTMCQQLLPSYQAKYAAFDAAYTCTCPSQKQPPSCQGPAHFNPATTTCAPETPFGSGVAPPWGGPNPQPQDWGINIASVGVNCETQCQRYGSCTQSCQPGISCTYPSGSTAVLSSGPSCDSLGLTNSWLRQYAHWGVMQYATYQRYGGVSGVTGYPNTCVVALAQPGTPPPAGWPQPTADNPLPWPYVFADCSNFGLPSAASSPAQETCQVFQATCSPQYIEGYPGWGGGIPIPSVSGNNYVAPNLPPAGYPGWQGPLITKTRSQDGCSARYACTGAPQTTIPVEMTCWGSYNNGPGSTGFGTMASISVPSGSSGGSYPDYTSTVVYQGPTAWASWGCNGNGAPVPSNAIVSCSGPICTVSLQITPSGSCANHIPPIQWNMYRDNYLPICPEGMSYKPALNLCTN